MKLVRITEDIKEYFSELDPLMLIARGDFGDNFAIGAILEDERTGQVTPVGLAVCMVESDTVTVLWLCIDPRYQRQHLGEELFGYIVDFARRSGHIYIQAYFDESYARKPLCYGEKQYFMEHGLKTEISLLGEWVTDVKTFLRHMEKNKGTEGGTIHFLNTFTSEQKSELMKYLEENELTSQIRVRGDRKQQFDDDLSCVLIDGEANLAGAVLIECIESTLYPIAFLTTDDASSRTIIYQVLLAARKKYGMDMPICMIPIHEAYGQLLTDLLPESKINNYLLWAEVAEILKQTNNEEDFVSDFYDLEEEMALSQSGKADKDPFGGMQLEEALKPGEDVYQTLGYMKNLPFVEQFSKDKKEENLMYSIGELKIRQITSILIDCHYYGYSGVLNTDLEKTNYEWFDPAYSYFLMDENQKITHVLLIHVEEDNTLFPLMLFTNNPEDQASLMRLISHAVTRASAEFSEDTKVRLRKHDEKSRALIEGLLKI